MPPARPCTATLNGFPKTLGLIKVALPRTTTDVVVSLHELPYHIYAPSLGYDRRDEVCTPFLHTPQSSYDSFKRTTERETKKTGERFGLQTPPDVRHAVRKTSAHVAWSYIAISLGTEPRGVSVDHGGRERPRECLAEDDLRIRPRIPPVPQIRRADNTAGTSESTSQFRNSEMRNPGSRLLSLMSATDSLTSELRVSVQFPQPDECRRLSDNPAGTSSIQFPQPGECERLSDFFGKMERPANSKKKTSQRARRKMCNVSVLEPGLQMQPEK